MKNVHVISYAEYSNLLKYHLKGLMKSLSDDFSLSGTIKAIQIWKIVSKACGTCQLCIHCS